VLGLKYGLSDAVIENYFSKVAYDIDQDKSIQATFNYYQSQQESDLVDVVGSVNTGQKTYAIKDPDNKPKFGEPQGPKGNTNLMVKYQDANVFTDTELTVDLYKQKIENIFFYSPVLSNPEQGFDGGQSLIKSDKQGFRATLNSLVDFGDVEGTFIYGLDILNDVTSQPLVDGRIWVPEMDMDNKAGFIQTKWIINQDWIVKAGIRKEDISLSVDNYKTLRLCRSAEQCSVSVDVKGGTLNYEATTYNAAIKYNAYEVFSPFVSYSEGADISDLGRLLRTATVTDIADIHTEASIIKNYEAGFNSQFENLRIEFSAYRSTSELGTSNKFDPVTGIYMPVRAPQKIWGIDFLASYPITDSLNVTATHSWVEGKNTENDTHLGLKQISPAKTTVNLGWSLDAATQLTLSMLNIGDRDKFTPDENGNYAGDQGPIKGYTLFNLSGTTQIQDWTLFAGVENLLNEDYFPAKSQGYTYSGYNNKGMGTSINIGASYTF
jgi:iron complex outermembrane receptor protein